MLKPSHIAQRVFLEAVRLGFPAEARPVSRDALLVSNDRGKAILYAGIVEGRLLTLAAQPGSPWYVVVGVLDDRGGLVEARPWGVPLALAQHEEMLSTFEADVWARRLRLAPRLQPSSRVPPRLKPYLVLGARVYSLPETMDYAAAVDGVIVAWYNEATDTLADSLRYALAMGLLGPRAREQRGLHG